MKKSNRQARSIPIAALLILAVLLSAASGIYAGASFFPQQAPNVTITTTIYTTTTSWTTSTVWSTLTSLVYGVWTTVTYTTSTSTITQTQTTSSTSSTTTPPPPVTSSIYATVNLRVPRAVTVTVTVSQGSKVVATQSHTLYSGSYTFVFGGLAAGTYTVTETATGTVGQSQTVTVPPDGYVTFTI